MSRDNKYTKCICECPIQPCPACPICPTCPKPQFGATSGSGFVPVKNGDLLNLLAIGGGGGGGGYVLNNTTSAYTQGGGGGRGQYTILLYPVSEDGMLTYTVGTGGKGGINQNGFPGTSSIISFQGSSGTKPIVIGEGGQGGLCILGGYSNGGDDGGGGGAGREPGTDNFLLGTGGDAGQGSPGQNATVITGSVPTIAGGTGGTGPVIDSDGFLFLSGVGGIGGAKGGAAGGGAGGVGAAGPNASIKGGDGTSNGAGGGFGWGAGGGGAGINDEGSNGGDGASGAIGISYVLSSTL